MKIVTFDDSSQPVIKDVIGDYDVVSKYMIVDYTDARLIGECTCCGGNEYIAISGNIIDIFCYKKDGIRYEPKCIHHHVDCPGIKDCPRKAEFDPDREKTVVALIHSILDSMHKIVKFVMLSNHPLVKKVVAEMILDNDYSIDVQRFEYDEKTSTFYVIGKRNWGGDEEDSTTIDDDFGTEIPAS